MMGIMGSIMSGSTLGQRDSHERLYGIMAHQPFGMVLPCCRLALHLGMAISSPQSTHIRIMSGSASRRGIVALHPASRDRRGIVAHQHERLYTAACLTFGVGICPECIEIHSKKQHRRTACEMLLRRHRS